MVNLLFSYYQSNAVVVVFWMMAVAVVVFLFMAIFIQRRKGRQLEEELHELDKIRQNNTEYEFVLKAMKIAVWRYDVQKQSIIYENDFREGVNTFVAEEFESFSNAMASIDASDAERVRQAFNDIVEGRTDYYHQEYRINYMSSGSSYWEESYATIVERDENGKPSKIVGTSQRIDERKEMEASLVTARNKAEESDRLKTAFLANMGHEIRTPLNAIVGFADLLPVVESEEDRKQLISEIQMNNHKLLQIIDGLVSMSKVEAEARSLVRAQTDIVPILKEIADNSATLVDGETVKVITQFPYNELLVNTDVGKLREAVDNLMQNAVKFTDHGTITLAFSLAEGDRVRISVEDTGKGIAPEDQQRIFERFVKVDDYIPGTGLGLSVAKSHIESLGGKIGVTSTFGKGSTFWIDLPLM